MKLRHTRLLLNGFIFSVLPILVGCQSDATTINTMKDTIAVKEHNNGMYSARIQRTSYNIPHITADDLPSAWFGQGYAMAEDRMCVLLDSVIKLRSQRAKYFGVGAGNANLDSDFAYKHIGLIKTVEQQWTQFPLEIQQMLTAYAAGINQFVKNVGVSGLPAACRDADWVVEVNAIDIAAIVADFNILLSGRFLSTSLSNAQPPNVKSLKPASISSLPQGEDSSPGSNGWGLGGDLTQSGNGILLAQPHFPWEGDLQTWESHVTVADEIDVYGVTTPGIPNMLVGFNSKVAWTLTVTTSPKAILYQLKLNPDNPTEYFYDGKIRAMESSKYTVEVLTEAGKLEQQSRTLWRSHYGPILSIPVALTGNDINYQWGDKVAISYRDANIDNTGMLAQFLDMSRAKGIESFIEAHERWAGGIPFSNTVASSVEGDAWYVDSSPVPNISNQSYKAWQETRKTDIGVNALFEYHGIYLFDGSSSRDEWKTEPESPRAGLVPFAKAPQLRRRDFVFNANDNHWLTNPNHPLEGYHPLYGAEGSETPSLRTRMNGFELNKASSSKPFTLESVKEVSLSNYSYTAYLVRDEIVKRCLKTPKVTLESKTIDLTAACKVLAEWDERFELDSKGAVLFREFLGFVKHSGHSHAQFTGDDTLFSTPFDAKQPIATPSGLISTQENGQDSILLALARAVKQLTDAQFAIDVSLGDMQFTTKVGKRIPIHGGNSSEGIMSTANYSSNGTLLGGVERGKLLNHTTGLTEDGYVVNFGTSFLMVVELDKQGPRCQGIASFSQSSDPDSPYFSDQTVLYSNKVWRPCHYSQTDIQADAALRVYQVGSKN